MATQIQCGRKYRVTKGKLTGYVGMVTAATFQDEFHGPHALLEIDDTCSLFVHPKDIELVKEPDEVDLRQVMLPGL